LRVSREGCRWRALQHLRALEAADAKQFGAYAIYLDVCRRKRNELSYESFGFVSDTELEELIEQTSKFRNLAMAWMRSRK